MGGGAGVPADFETRSGRKTQNFSKSHRTFYRIRRRQRGGGGGVLVGIESWRWVQSHNCTMKNNLINEVNQRVQRNYFIDKILELFLRVKKRSCFMFF